MESPQTPLSSTPTLFERSIAAVGYLGIFCLLPLLLHRDSAFALHHGKQGFVILLTWVLLWIGAIVPIIGAVVWFFGSIGLLLLILFGMVQALYGNLWEIPILGAYAKKLDF